MECAVCHRACAQAIALECHSLTWFSALCVDGIDDTAARSLAQGCPALRTLRLGPGFRHPQLTSAGIGQLKAARPFLVVDGGPKPPQAQPSKRRRRTWQ